VRNRFPAGTFPENWLALTRSAPDARRPVLGLLPMNDPAAAHFMEAIADLGFFFIGVVPKYFGDSPSLRFEYLNNVEIHTESIASPPRLTHAV
jgi:hypothetical protein